MCRQFKPVTRPENRTMEHLLEIQIQPATTEALREFDKKQRLGQTGMAEPE